MNILEILEKVSKGELKDGVILKSNSEYHPDIIITKDDIKFYVNVYNEIEIFKISSSEIIALIEDEIIYK